MSDWRHHALCRDEDPELFFPVGLSTGYDTQVGAAKAICALCPVQHDCLAWARQTRQRHGVWGGVLFDSPAERLRFGQRRSA